MLNHQIIGKGKTLVFLHGFLESIKIWKNFINELKTQYQVIVIDLPGHGKSETFREINTMEEMAEDIIDVLDYLNIEKATFIGHSMGGYVTCALADLYPSRVENIVLVNSSTLPDDEAKKNQRLKACKTAQENLNALVTISIPNLFAKHHREEFRKEIDIIKEIALETPIDGVCAALKGMRERPDRSSILYDFKGGIYIIIGENDETVNPELFLSLIPKSPTIQLFINNSGHMAYIENYNDVVSILKTI